MQLARLLKARRHLRQQHVAVRAVRPQRERLASEHSTSRPGGLPRLVDQILGAVPRYGSVPLVAARSFSIPTPIPLQPDVAAPSVVRGHYPGFPNETSRCPKPAADVLPLSVFRGSRSTGREDRRYSDIVPSARDFKRTEHATTAVERQ